MLIDSANIVAAITTKTKVILPVHYWGLACDMDAIMKIARKHHLKVIEDCCQAHGELYKGKKVETFGDCAAFSLNQNNNLSAGDGGLFVSDDDTLFVHVRAVMSFGEMRAPDAKRDFHSYALGWMYRTSDIAAAYARSRLKYLDKDNVNASQNWNRLDEGLKGIPGLIQLVETKTQKTNSYTDILRIDPPKVPTETTLAARQGDDPTSNGYC